MRRESLSSVPSDNQPPLVVDNPPYSSIDLPHSVPSCTTIDLDFDSIHAVLDIDVPPLAASDAQLAPIQIGSLDDFIDFASIDDVLNW